MRQLKKLEERIEKTPEVVTRTLLTIQNTQNHSLKGVLKDTSLDLTNENKKKGSTFF